MNMKNLRKHLTILFLITYSIFATGCMSKNELRSSADKNRQIAEEYRKVEYGDLGIYYSDIYNKRADKADAEANKMILNDPYSDFLIKALWFLISDNDEDQ
jgi:hypothetical protein